MRLGRTCAQVCAVGLLVAVSACSTVPSSISRLPPSDLPKGARIQTLEGPLAEVQQSLLAQLRDWQGTPYRLGGTSRQGIDCSAFVQTTLSGLFKVSLPRSTDQQSRVGFEVEPQYVLPGDLVFFRTGRQSSHVGVYVGSRWFLHASTSEGVTLNSLDEPYWRRTFTSVRRVMF
ncbi:MAG: NlpC/P60 family protein [Limnobacter sp.]|uniref:NlpC/P60 family protein n=1 Tax=Limnobacter sp. TaxID=2003368 RepID=UPI00391B76F6